MQKKRNIFVFNTNESGQHKTGTALDAVQRYGAQYGKPVGIQGNSYAIPIRDKNFKILPIDRIKSYVDDFLIFARLCPEMQFLVTNIGCGMQEYKDFQIAPLFKNCPKNCNLPSDWIKLL